MGAFFLLFFLADGYQTPRAFPTPGWRPAVRYAGASLSPSFSRVATFRAEKGSAEEEPAAVSEDDAAPAEEAPAAEDTGDDITKSPVFLKKKIEVLESELKDLDDAVAEQSALQEAEWAEWGEQIERMRSEFDAIKRRTGEQRNMAESAEKAQILASIFPATDNFDRAKQYTKPKNEQEEKIAAKYIAIDQTLTDAFEKLGVDVIDETGVPFDPAVHSAAMYQPSPDFALDTISGILEKGYKIQQLLIRPATVVVSSGQG